MTHSPTICLAMLVHDEAAIIDRCLQTVKPFIDQWLIYDLSSENETALKAEHNLIGKKGLVKSHTTSSYSDARNKLLAEASKMADWVLMLNADDQLQIFSTHLPLPNNADVGLVTINHPNYSSRSPRLFRSTAIPSFQFAAGEKAILENKRTSVINDFSIHCRADGLLCKNKNDPIANRFLIESVLEGKPDNPTLALCLAKLELQKNQAQLALSHLQLIIEQFPESAEFWQASYLAGNILLATGNYPKASEYLQACFDQNPERVEPIMCLADAHYKQADYSTAKALCELIKDLPIPTHADYFEPSVYQYKSTLLLAESQLKLKDYDAAQTSLEQLQSTPQLPDKVKQRISLATEHIHTQQQTEHTTTIRPATYQAETETPPSPLLTVGMATHDDFDGVYFSIMSIVLYQPELLDQIEILVIDNNPDSVHGDAVKRLCNRAPTARYVAAAEYKGTAVRERIFSEARGEYVLCIDCHVFLYQDALTKLLAYFKANPDSKDLLHGPLFYDDYEQYSTHMEPEWNQGFYGRWGSDPRGADIAGEPFEIPLQGMGLFACVKKHWLGFNHKFRGFGGEEGYIHEKFRQHGGQVLCLPFLRWAHRFDRPNSPSYANRWEDRMRNYLIGWHELNLDPKPVLEHFAEHLSPIMTSSANAHFLNERNSPLWAFDTLYCHLNDPTLLEALSLQHIAQTIDDITEMSRLLTIAISRRLSDVVVIQANDISATHLFEQLTTMKTAAEDTTADMILFDDKNTNNQLAIIKPRAFKAASQSYGERQTISSEFIKQLDHTINIVLL